MKKYWIVIKNTWDEMLTYRLNFMMWRIRMVLHVIAMYFLWLAVLPQDGAIGGYSQTMMLTYILGTSLLGAIVLSSRSYSVGDEINSGDLSNYLIRPVNYFSYWFAKDLGDKAMNIVFSITELTILFFIIQPPVFLQTNIIYLLLFLLSILCAVVLYFFFNLLLGFIGFWSPEVWAPRFIFYVTVGFFAGGYFPLDILSGPVAIVFKTLPFSYLLYFPLKIYLGQLSIVEALQGLIIGFLWVVVLYICVQMIWKKGILLYTAQGR